MGALNRISPVRGSVQDAAQDAGNAITRFTKAGESEASKRVNHLFESVDPFGETRFNLPIDRLDAALQKYIGRGTFGMGADARQAVDVAKQIGTETLDAVTPATAGRSEQTLLAAVKRAGGINPNSLSSREVLGEIRNLKEQGLGRIVSKSGKSVEKLAEDMYQRGFIPDDDPVTLLNALRDGGGDVAVGGGERSMRAAFERSMGEAPEAETVLKQLPFREVQNYRSSLVSKIDKLASKPGNQGELAALRAMKLSLIHI